jgi:Family of unknown function (DUF6317)
MSDGFQVVMSDLLSASGVFEREAGTLKSVVANGGPRAPNGGNGVINAAISNALRAASLTTGQLAAVIDEHSAKLHVAYERYHSTEETNTQLCHQLIKMAQL